MKKNIDDVMSHEEEDRDERGEMRDIADEHLQSGQQYHVPMHNATHYATHNWHYGLFVSCYNMQSCLEACCCTTCQLTRQYNALFQDRWRKINWPMCILLTICDSNTACVISMMTAYFIRNKLRARYNIQGTECDDFFAVCCCYPCALQQQLVEMTVNNEFPGAFCYDVRPPVQYML